MELAGDCNNYSHNQRSPYFEYGSYSHTQRPHTYEYDSYSHNLTLHNFSINYLLTSKKWVKLSRTIVHFNFRETLTRRHLLSSPPSLLMEDACSSSTSHSLSPLSVIEVTTITSLLDIMVSPPLAQKMAPSSNCSKTMKQTTKQSRMTTKLAKKKQQTNPTASCNSNVSKEIKKLNRDEKAMVKIDHHPTAISGLKSSVWFKVTHIDWKEMHHFFKLKSPDFCIHKGLANIDNILREPRYQASVAKDDFTPFY